MKKVFPTFYAMTMSINGLFWRSIAIPMGFDLPQMFRELASMLDSDVPLDRSLTLISEGRNQHVRMRMNRVRERVESGEPLSEALAALPRSWSDTIRDG